MQLTRQRCPEKLIAVKVACTSPRDETHAVASSKGPSDRESKKKSQAET